MNLAGDSLSIADIAIFNEIASIITIYDELKLTIEGFPFLTRWYQGVYQIESVKTGINKFQSILRELNKWTT